LLSLPSIAWPKSHIRSLVMDLVIGPRRSTLPSRSSPLDALHLVLDALHFGLDTLGLALDVHVLALVPLYKVVLGPLPSKGSVCLEGIKVTSLVML